MNYLHELKNTLAGAEILRDWFGAGLRPVSQDTANSRALACLHGHAGGECPHLSHPNWWDRQKGAVAFAIKEQLEAKSKMKLETALDQHPRMCSACGCCMPVKVWTPIDHIAAHTSEESISKMPPYCWQRIEMENK